MHVIRDIGSYAGLLAIPAVAVLAGLLFSQARDLKRLRQWAGRAPERAAQATRYPQAPPSAPPGVPTSLREPESATAVRPGALAPGAAVEGPQAGPPAFADAPPSVPNGDEAGGAATLRGERTEAGPGPASRLRPPFAATPAARHDYSGPSSRRVPILAAVAVLAVVAIVVIVTQVGGGGSTPRPATHVTTSAATPPSPSNVNVAVLNATAVPGLGAQFGGRVQRAGFHLQGVGNAPQHGRAQSTVLYAQGASADAALVEQKLGISRDAPADAADRSRAPAASVIVVLGADRAG